MLQKTFSIYADNLDGCTLFVEAGVQHIACWCKHAETGAIRAFEFFQFDAADSIAIATTLQNIRLQSKLMDMGISPEVVVWDNTEVLCIPEAFYNEDVAPQYLDIVIGEKQGTEMLTQPLNKQVVISRLSNTYTGAFKKTFGGGAFSHKFSLLLKKYFQDNGQPGDQPHTVFAIFYPSHFIVTAIKSGVLQIMRSVEYSTSEDVLYIIMQICDNYDMPLNDTAIVASGLIDTASNLYNTLYAYLEHFTLEKTGSTVFDADSFSEYPAHYFLPFIFA